MSLLGELFAQLAGEAAIESLLGAKKGRAPFPEGKTDALLGAVSAFFATTGFFFALPSAMLAVFVGSTSGTGMGSIVALALLGLVASCGALLLSRKGLRVTRCNLRLITYGVVVGLPGMVLSIIALLASGIRAFL